MLESLVLREISFNAKIRIFSKLIKLHYPEITHTFPSFLKDLNKVRETRNRYAHSVIDLRDNFLRLNKHNTLRYQIHQDGKKVHSDMTKKELEEELSIAQGVTEQISMILNYVSEEAKTR